MRPQLLLPLLLLAVALNGNDTNALGHGFVGFEAGLLHDFRFGKHVGLFLNLQLLVPGKAASVFVNDVEREATGVVGGGELGFKAWF